MKIARAGISRTVFIFRKYVVKVPKLRYGWYFFLVGLTSNIEENKCWKITRSPLLCPVRWMSWGGWFLVMKRADVSRHKEEVRREISEGKAARCYASWINAGFGGDDKPDNYGYLGDQLVKIDYPNFSSRSIADVVKVV